MARRPTRAPRTPQAPPDLGGHGDSAPAGAAVATAGGGKMADDLDELLDEVERRLCRLPGMGTVAGPRHGDGEEEERSAAKESRSAVLRRSRVGPGALTPIPAEQAAGGAARPVPPPHCGEGGVGVRRDPSGTENTEVREVKRWPEVIHCPASTCF